MAGIITGRVQVLVNGNVMLSKEGAVARGIGQAGQVPVAREAVMGDNGINGFKETPVPAECELTITDRDDISLGDLAAINGDGTLIFKAFTPGGKVYTMHNATCLSNLELTGGDGDVAITFQGPLWVETT